jgi:acyl-CoA thioesterase YciA
MKFQVEAWRRSRDGDEQIEVKAAVYTFGAFDSGYRPCPLPPGWAQSTCWPLKVCRSRQ